MKILHLYSDLLNLYGEYGNVSCLKKHLEDQGIKVSVFKANDSSKIDFNEYDFIYCGSGLESNLKVALKDLKKNKKSFIEAVNNNKYILFTGNSMELLGERIDDIEALNIAPIYSSTTNKRFTGDVIVRNDEFNEVVGFINRSSVVVERTRDGLFNYVFKDPALKEKNDVEGYRINNLIGTHIIGPILVKNPKLMEYFVKGIGSSVKKNFVYHNVLYSYEEDSYEVTLNALKDRIK